MSVLQSSPCVRPTAVRLRRSVDDGAAFTAAGSTSRARSIARSGRVAELEDIGVGVRAALHRVGADRVFGSGADAGRDWPLWRAVVHRCSAPERARPAYRPGGHDPVAALSADRLTLGLSDQLPTGADEQQHAYEQHAMQERHVPPSARDACDRRRPVRCDPARCRRVLGGAPSAGRGRIRGMPVAGVACRHDLAVRTEHRKFEAEVRRVCGKSLERVAAEWLTTNGTRRIASMGLKLPFNASSATPDVWT